MALSTYTELQDSILAWLGRSGNPTDEAAVHVEDFIRLGEIRFGNRLRVQEMERRLQAVLNEPQETVPARFLAVKSAGIQMPSGSNNSWYDLKYVSYAALTRYWREPHREPFVYTIVGNEFLFGPFFNYDADVSDADRPTLELVAYTMPVALSSTNASNKILDRFPNVYLYASLIEAGGFLVSEQLSTWVAAFDDAIEQANMSWVDAHDTPRVSAPSAHLIV